MWYIGKQTPLRNVRPAVALNFLYLNIVPPNRWTCSSFEKKTAPCSSASVREKKEGEVVYVFHLHKRVMTVSDIMSVVNCVTVGS